ncbi:MAG: PD-(D/E)XK nuclease family protein, partial [Firmicutes bacterium]|nr:PD-(D/E)XK nuclease family protein [Bacillota bacterium]
DIVVICNDQQVRGSILRRVFEEYGIKIFDDKKRSIMSSPVAMFMTALLEVISSGFNTADLFKVLKTGFTEITAEDIEDLENYAIKYRVRGFQWKKPFVKGQLEYGDDGLERLNGLREQVVQIFTGVETLCKESGTVRDFVEGYYDYLVETLSLDRFILDLIEQQKERQLLELAEETGQIWGKIMGLFEQIVELSGEEAFDVDVFVEMLQAGLSQLEVGVLPPTSDDLLMGTMQRTRSGQAKAMIVVGANEGVLPANGGAEGLFSLEELEFLAEGGTEICKADTIRVWEEQLAIYRNLSKPTHDLWISYAVSNEEGKELRPSEIIDSLKRLFPGLKVEKDVLNCGDANALIGGKLNTLRHLTKALQDGSKGEKVDGAWKVVLDWFKGTDKEMVDQISRGLSFTNIQPDLPKDVAEMLYKHEGVDEFILSPSRLERFSRCPFAHFVLYGLRPEERRVFEASSREIGDLYHQCLMEISEKLSAEKRWDLITEEECRQLIGEITAREAKNYREGVFQFSNEERYKLTRVEDTCFHVCWALIEQVRNGQILESKYEVPFGRRADIPPITVDCGDKQVLIEGKIDRLDVLDKERVKIIDYKTGREIFDVAEARGGYRLQLMLYLKAAQQQVKKPAGVFYFLIDDPRVDVTGTESEKTYEKISKEMKKAFRLNGVMVDNGSVIRSIAGEFDGYSDIVPLYNGKEGIKGTSSDFLLSEEEFAKLQADVDGQIEKLCKELCDGRIAINPKKTERTSPCVYCQFQSICRFDTDFEGCNYDIIR